MDTPVIAQYYKETDPLKRKRLLDMAIEEGSEPEANAIRKELYDVRYAGKSEMNKNMPADGYLGLWMMMEYNRSVGSGLFGLDTRRAAREIRKILANLKFQEYQDKGGLYAELHYKEVCHMVRTYMTLSKSDRNYNSTIFGMMKMSDERSSDKLKNDVINMAVGLPEKIGMVQELEIVTRAAREVYEEFFPLEGGF